MAAELTEPSHPAEVPVSELTPRQKEILGLIADGKTWNQIGAILALSPRTVEHHVTLIHRRLKISGAAALTRYAIRQGLREA